MGTHFFYTCNVVDGVKCDETWCSNQLAQKYFKTDNLVFNFMPATRARLQDAGLCDFNKSDDVCVTDSDLADNFIFPEPDEGETQMVTVAVMDSEANFNITRGATFTDIIFRGDYGLL